MHISSNPLKISFVILCSKQLGAPIVEGGTVIRNKTGDKNAHLYPLTEGILLLKKSVQFLRESNSSRMRF